VLKRSWAGEVRNVSLLVRFGKSLLASDEVVIEATANSMGVSWALVFRSHQRIPKSA
jgi:hypothetical protein